MSMGGGSSSGTSQTELSDEQKKLIKPVIPIGQQYATNPPDAYQGDTVAGLTGAQTLGGQMIKKAAKGKATNLANTAAKGLNFITSGDVLSPDSNPALGAYMQSAIRPVEESFTRAVLPNIRDQALASGGFGDSRYDIAQGIAGSDYLKTIGDITSEIAYQGYGQGLDAMSRGFAFAPGIQQALFAPGSAVSAVGAQKQGVNQANLDAAMRQYYTEQFLPLAVAQEVAGMAFGMPTGSISNTVSGGGSTVGNALGYGATGAGLGTMISPGYGTAIGGALGALYGLFQ